MESPERDNLITGFKGEGGNIVAAIGKKSYKDGELEINRTQYFEGIPMEGGRYGRINHRKIVILGAKPLF